MPKEWPRLTIPGDDKVGGDRPQPNNGRLLPLRSHWPGEAVERIVVTGKPSPELGTELDRRTSGRKPEN